jgi:hypothetical protein
MEITKLTPREPKGLLVVITGMVRGRRRPLLGLPFEPVAIT